MSLLTNFARGVKVELIAKLATSYEAYDGGTLIKGVAPHNIRDYFRKYGSTARKFDHIADDDIYVGYVRMSGKPEFLSALVLAGDNAVAVSFDSEVDESNDFLTLMAKKEFADRMTAAVQRAAGLMRQPAPATAAPQAAEMSELRPPADAVRKKHGFVGWPLVLTIGAVIAIAITVQALTAGQRLPLRTATADALHEDYGSGAEGAVSETGIASPRDAGAPALANDREGTDATLTFGMVDSILGGVDSFLAAYRTGGMLEAETQSRQCLDRAAGSEQIHILDECAAFDFTAQFIDNAAVDQAGLPANRYFSETNARLERAYARFPEHNMQRFALLKGHTAVLMRENGIGL